MMTPDPGAGSLRAANERVKKWFLESVKDPRVVGVGRDENGAMILLSAEWPEAPAEVCGVAVTYKVVGKIEAY